MTVGSLILNLVRSEPGITAGEIAARLDKRLQHIHSECGALENTHAAYVDRSARPYRYYLSDAALRLSSAQRTPSGGERQPLYRRI